MRSRIADEEYLENIDERKNFEAIPDLAEDEVEAAIHRLKQRKAAGPDNITAEELQAGTNGVGVRVMHRLCQAVWEKEELPAEWKRSIIIPIHKKRVELDRLHNYPIVPTVRTDHDDCYRLSIEMPCL